MYEWVGTKIKSLTKIICGIGIAVSVIGGVVLIFTANFLTGIIVAVVGALSSWISGFMLYGYGEIVDNLMEMNYRLQHMDVGASGKDSFYVYAQDGVYTETPENGWRCACGRVHLAYESSCVCGKSKRDAMTKQ
ncbi:MAG: hypothetical protein E7470_04295 [Ruminococcaceae bacterium]|nr:hypothetical protein [Oscillospiraceae bacterium]